MTDVYVASGYWGAGYVSEDAVFAAETPLQQSRTAAVGQVGNLAPALDESRLGATAPTVTPPAPS